jgi:hypothetical protein
MTMPRRRLAVIIVALCGMVAAALLAPHVDVATESLPRQLSDRAFWRMVVDFSEPGGYFRSDNLISNETTFQHVIPELRKFATGGVYVGVGPDQNFTYIAALEPRMAFIIDIRRQNMLLHLMYKAIIETSEDRADFLARLFSRPRPPNLDRTAPAQALFDAFNQVASSNALFQRNLRLIMDRLVTHHGFALTADDSHSIEYVYRAFYLGGPELRYSFPQQFAGRFPTYSELMTETDRSGRNHSYMATEENFRALKAIERNNLLVPLVGDFGGDKTIRRVGQYLRMHGATTTLFYTSNVEQYLFQTDAWRRFYENVETLPITENSTFVRSYFNMRFVTPRTFSAGLRSQTLLDPISSLIAEFRAGQIQSYEDVISRSN